MRTVETKEIIISGPTDLTQGGRGIILKKAIFDPQGNFWGIVAIILNLSSIKINKKSKLAKANTKNHNYREF